MSDDESGDDGCVIAVVGLVMLVPFVLVCALVGAASWWHERDLRDLRSLTRTTAEVVDVDEGGKYSRDEYEVRFRSESGVDVQTEVPIDVAISSQREVEVAYDPTDPKRVRTVEEWEPLYAHMAVLSVIAVAVLPILVLWAATRPLRRRLRALLPGRGGSRGSE